jgi:hypothetical protein
MGDRGEPPYSPPTDGPIPSGLGAGARAILVYWLCTRSSHGPGCFSFGKIGKGEVPLDAILGMAV